jgi:hypothetical protein
LARPAPRNQTVQGVTILDGKHVTRETDFLDMYRALGLQPGCGLDEFRQAYRRRVAVLHPDRRAGNRLDVRAAERLQRLTAQYNAAMEFQRRHGRLPGAAAPATHPSIPPATLLRASRPLQAATRAGRRSRSRLLILLAAVAAGVLLWNVDPFSLSSGSTSAPAQADPAMDVTEAPTTPALAVGMSIENVRAIEGNPDAIDGDRWEYGASWIRFAHGQVADWYSAPEHTLKAAGTPAPATHS